MNPQNTFYRIGGMKGSRFSHPQATMVPAKKNDLFDKRCPKKTLDTALGVFWYCQIEHFYYHMSNHVPAGIYLFKVNNRNTWTMYEICSKLTIKIPERCWWSLLLTLNRFHTLLWYFYCWLWASKCQLGVGSKIKQIC